MASSGTRPDDSRATSESIQPEKESGNNDLCRLCLQALTINDHLAGGTIQENAADGTTALDLSGFTFNDWESSRHDGSWQRRFPNFRTNEKRDASGWVCHRTYRSGSRFYHEQTRSLCAGDQHERLVTLPRMHELSVSAIGSCRLCSRLRALFVDQYAEQSWWNQPGSTLRFTIQYEWSEQRTIIDGEDKAATLQFSQSFHELAVQRFNGLTVLVVHPGKKADERDFYRFEVVAWPGPCKQWLKIKNTPLDPLGPASDRNIEFMRQCIDRCINDHARCKTKTSNPKFVPTRLLDLGTHSSSSVTLIECGQTLSLPHPETELQYASLSYCWGKSLTMTTTVANKFKHETTGINIHNMPATFQDAIYVTKKLGIRYLDWEAEAINMCDVFAHSRITISAAKGSSSAEHFLQRDVDETLTLHFQSVLKPDVSGRYSIRLEPQHHDNPAEHDIALSAWKSRAWVWQEEIMSTRQVIFGSKSVQFRCEEAISMENGYRHFHPGSSMYEGLTYWTHTIHEYSTRTLTYASDRLKAIAGVANFGKNSFEGLGKPPRYLVGLWQDMYFDKQLRWVCMQPFLSRDEMMRLLRDKETYIAPSWSWASRNIGVVCLQRLMGETVFRVIKTDLPASHKSAMISVAFGSSITISGSIRRTPVEPSSGRLVTDPDEPYPRWEASSICGHTKFWLDWVPKKNDPEESEFQRQLCLLLTTNWDRSESLGGLIIAPMLDPSTGVLFYYRVGAFDHTDNRQLFTSEPLQEVTIR